MGNYTDETREGGEDARVNRRQRRRQEREIKRSHRRSVRDIKRRMKADTERNRLAYPREEDQE